MEYSIQNNYSPVHDNQEYVWFADFASNSVFEYDDSVQETPFGTINLDGFERFGLIGNGFRTYFSKNGVFFAFGDMVNPHISLDGEQIDLSTTVKCPFTFKRAYVDASMGADGFVTGKPHIESYVFGYDICISDTIVRISCTVPSTGEDQRPFLSIEVGPENKKELKISFDGEEPIVFGDSNGEPQIARYGF